jgi:hypothetical protein
MGEKIIQLPVLDPASIPVGSSPIVPVTYSGKTYSLALYSAVAGAGADQNAQFSSENYVQQDQYIGSRYRWGQLVILQSASLVCSAPNDAVVITLVVNGVNTACSFSIAAAQTGAEIDGLSIQVTAGQYVQWLCTTAPDNIGDSVSGVFISLNLVAGLKR